MTFVCDYILQNLIETDFNETYKNCFFDDYLGPMLPIYFCQKET